MENDETIKTLSQEPTLVYTGSGNEGNHKNDNNNMGEK